MINPFDPRRMAVQIAAAQQALNQAPVTIDKVQPFLEVNVDLNVLLNSTQQSLPVPATGRQLIYRREGSAPGGRLNVVIGGVFTDFYPGARIVGKLEGMQLQYSGRSSPYGLARLIVVKQDFDFIEPSDTGMSAIVPVDLAGTMTTDGAPRTLLTGTVPTFADGTTYVYPSGYSRLRIIVDAALYTGAYTITPYLIYPKGGGTPLATEQVSQDGNGQLILPRAFAVAGPLTGLLDLAPFIAQASKFSAFQITPGQFALLGLRVDTSDNVTYPSCSIWVQGVA